MAENMNDSSRIGMMCPSVMISGAGNFPVKKKEKQNAAADRNYQKFQEIQGILRKMEGILHGKDIIKSGDERFLPDGRNWQSAATGWIRICSGFRVRRKNWRKSWKA